jgi:hypothetical protein
VTAIGRQSRGGRRMHLGAAPAQHAGVASAVNNDVARVAGLIVVFVLPALAGITRHSCLDPLRLSTGCWTAVVAAGAPRGHPWPNRQLRHGLSSPNLCRM